LKQHFPVQSTVEYDAHAEKTLLVYMMYDTQPFTGEEWTSPPLEAKLVDIEPFGKCVIARGAINTKGPLVAFLNALESILAVGDEIPVNLKFMAQGDEELGSVDFARFVEEHKEMLGKADALYGPDASKMRKARSSSGSDGRELNTLNLNAAANCGEEITVGNILDFMASQDTHGEHP
jgi:acetylornithine deacetylase/succinyl-diaminopimelate desuccinylase-like protein